MPLDLAYDLSNFTPADATPLQANFTHLEQYTNQEVIARDGTTAMLAQLKLVGNPVSPLDAAAKQYVDLLLPVGVILPFGGAVAPGAGIWAVANGASLATAAYPDLFAVYGYAHGGSAGNFNLPNLVDRMPIGASATKPLGSSGGSAASSLVDHDHSFSASLASGVAAMKSTDHVHKIDPHYHTGTTDDGGAHDHGWGPEGFLYNSGVASGFGLTTSGGIRTATWAGAPNHKHSFTTGNNAGGAGNTGWQSQTEPTWGQAAYQHDHTVTGSVSGTTAPRSQLPPDPGVTAANSNLPPYVAVNWICRVG